MKIRVECRAIVFVDVSVTAKQVRQLDAGEISLSDIIDESVPYQALSADGEFEFTEWDRVQPTSKRKRTQRRSRAGRKIDP